MSTNFNHHNKNHYPAKPGHYPITSLFDNLNNIINNYSKEWTTNELIMPSCDFSESENHYLLHIELPGIKKENIDISISDNKLIIKGEKTSKTEESHKKFYHCERLFGSFYRSIELPRDSDSSIENIEAQLIDGVLEIKIPKSKKSTMQKISIK